MHISTRQCKTTFCTHYKVLAAEEEGTGTWLACLQSRPVSNRECVAHFEAQNADNEDPVLLPTLRLVCRKNGTKITPETLHHLVSSVPKRLLSVVKRNGNITKVVNALLSQLFLECVAGLNDRKGCIFTNDMKLTRQNMKYFVFICLQWNTSQSKFRNHYFLFLFAFSILSQLFWFGVVLKYIFRNIIIIIY